MATTKGRGRPPVKTVALKNAKIGDKVKYKGKFWTVTDKFEGIFELTRKFGKKTEISFTDPKAAGKGSRGAGKPRPKGRRKVQTTPMTRAYVGDRVKYEGKIWEVYGADEASVSLKRTYGGKTYYRRAIDREMPGKRKARKTSAPKKAAAKKAPTKKPSMAKKTAKKTATNKAPSGTKKAAQMSLFGKSTGESKAQSSAKGEKVTHKGKRYLVVDSKGRGDARTIRLKSVSSNRAFTMLAKNLTP